MKIPKKRKEKKKKKRGGKKVSLGFSNSEVTENPAWQHPPGKKKKKKRERGR